MNQFEEPAKRFRDPKSFSSSSSFRALCGYTTTQDESTKAAVSPSASELDEKKFAFAGELSSNYC